MHQQSWNIEHPWSDVLVWMVQYNGASGVVAKNIDLLPSVMVVKMTKDPGRIRHEARVLEALNAAENASLHVPKMLKAQITTESESSWLVASPVFGLSLKEFGEKQGGLASWLVAHVFIGLLESVAYIHAAGYSHGGITTDNVMLDVYPRVMWHRFRGYPDVVLTDFSTAKRIDDAAEGKDARAVFMVMKEVIAKYSDAAPFVEMADKDEEIVTVDPILLILHDIRVLLANQNTTLADMREQFEARLVDIRHTGPEQLPRSLSRVLHSDLVANAEFGHALREPTMLKFDAKHEDFVKIVANERVEIGAGGHAGMKTKQIMVLRFTMRKEGFMRIVGGDDGGDDDMDMDVDGEFEVDVESERPSDEMDVDPAPSWPPRRSMFGGD
jgi:tRNA A-37 threonylcarbamoyl transferase component Bud32